MTFVENMLISDEQNPDVTEFPLGSLLTMRNIAEQTDCANARSEELRSNFEHVLRITLRRDNTERR